MEKYIPLADLVPLNLLRVGQRALVSQILGLPEQVKRLAELGVRDGAQVRIVQSGSPCIIQLDNQRLCFRDCDLLSVLVCPTGELGADA